MKNECCAKKDVIIARLEAIIAAQAATIIKLEARIAELERRLGLDSSNSSKPPSSDGLRKKPSPQSLREKCQKKSGGQDGHKGNTLKQVINPTFIERYKVERCDACGNSLSHQEPIKVIKRQVFDIPAPRIEVTEHQVEVKHCQCGHQTVAGFPENVVAPVQYGTRVKALAIYLANQQLIPEDRLQQLFGDIFALPISTATLVTMTSKFAQKITLYMEEILQKLKVANVKNMDETGMRVGKKTCWTHVLSNNFMTHYRASPKRKNLLDGITGVIVHDHWKPYFCMENVVHALCNAHHLRELQALIDIEKESWAAQMSCLLKLLSHEPNHVIENVSRAYDQIIAQGLVFHEAQIPLSGRKKRIGHNLVLRLANYKNAVLRFLTTPDVPFTNNQAEQDIRMMKVKQKISGCFRTMLGAEIFCTIRGFLSTKRKQNENLFEAILAYC